MGNQVVFSVSYDHLDEIENKDFGNLSRQTHDSPSIPRFFTKSAKLTAHYQQVSTPGIAFSCYNHASDGAVLAVSTQGITQPSMAHALTSLVIEGGMAGIIKVLKGASKFMLPEPHSVLRTKAKPERIDPDKHSRCMVFGYLTDNSSELSADKNLLSKIANHMRDPANNGLPRNIEKVAILEPGEQILVKMYGNCFDLSAKFSAGNGLTFESWSREVGANTTSSDARRSNTWACKQLMANLGYDLEPMAQKNSG
jgi:hypothetical protein